MPYSGSIQWIICFLTVSFLSLTSVSGQCEFLQSDIEQVRSEAMEVLRVSDTLVVFIDRVSESNNYRLARSSSRRTQIYSGEILAAAYRIALRTDEAYQRALACEVQGAVGHLVKANSYAAEVRELSDQAFAYAKKAYASRNLATIKRYLNQSLLAAQMARKAAIRVAEEASGAHFCCAGSDIATRDVPE